MIEVHSGGISSLHANEKQYALDEKRSREMYVVRNLDLGPFPSGSSERSQRRLRLTFTGENSQPFPPQRPHEDSCNLLASGCSPSSASHTNPQKMPLSRPRTAAIVDYRVLCCLPQWLVFCVPPRKVGRSPMLFSWFAGKKRSVCASRQKGTRKSPFPD